MSKGFNIQKSDRIEHGIFADDSVKTLSFAGMVTGVTGYSSYYDTHHPFVDPEYMAGLSEEDSPEGMTKGIVKRLPVKGYTLDECCVCRWQGQSGHHYEGSSWVKSRLVVSYYVVGSKKREALSKAQKINEENNRKLGRRRAVLLNKWGVILPKETIILWELNDDLIPRGYQTKAVNSSAWAAPYYFSRGGAKTLEECVAHLKNAMERILVQQV